jgi:acyl-coenzyme A thioesterase PaaI-like protein
MRILRTYESFRIDVTISAASEGTAVRPSLFRRLMNLWPPFFFNSIAVTEIATDWSIVSVKLRRRFWNRNFVGTHFGGNLFAMTDPFWMLMLIHRLGDGYVVWDKAATIEFVAPGRGDVSARFELTPTIVEELRLAAKDGAKVLRWFDVDVKNDKDEIVARVRKQVYVRRKRERSGEGAGGGSLKV